MTTLQNFDLYDEPSSTAADVYVTCQHSDAQCTCASTERRPRHLRDHETATVRRSVQADESFDDEQLIKALSLCYWSGRKDAAVGCPTDRFEAVIDAALPIARANQRSE